MQNTLDLTKDIRDLQNELFYMDEKDQNYESYKAQLDLKMKQKQWSIERTCMYYADMSVEQGLDVDAAQTVADRANKKLRSAKNKQEWTKRFLKELAISAGISKLKTDYCNVSIFNGRETAYLPEGFDASNLPEQYRKDVPATCSAKKAEITKALKAGEDVCGLKLLRGEMVMRFS